jgi:hypothetical protein
MTPRPLPTRQRAKAVCVFTVLTVLVCAGLMSAAVLAHAPIFVVPCMVAVCIGCPIAAAWDLPVSIAVLRASRPDDRPLDSRALMTLRRNLDRLPETQHPLGL